MKRLINMTNLLKITKKLLGIEPEVTTEEMIKKMTRMSSVRRVDKHGFVHVHEIYVPNKFIKF